MPKYIKSHSNYVLKKRHQDISDGTIWERDITTIGGVNQFSPGQIPIYKSSNFIITVRDDGKISNQYNQVKWKENASGDTWTLENISAITSDFEDQNDVKIVLKQDYYDFCDFAYYGSLTEMFRASINDIFNRFPGELYGTNEYAYYTTGITEDFEKYEGNVPLGKPMSEYTERKITVKNNKYIECPCVNEDNSQDTKDRYVDNPFGIDVHSIKRPIDGKELKFFADNGYKNYQIINGDGDEGTQVENWQTRNFIKVVKYESVLDSIYYADAFYYDYLKPEVLQKYFNRPDNEIWWMQNDNNKVTEEGREDYEELERRFANGDIWEKFKEYKNKWWIEKITKPSDECDCVEHSVYQKFFDTEEEATEELPEETTNERYEVKNGAMCGNIECYIGIPCKGYKAASVTADTVIIGAWVGDNQEIVYLSDEANMDGIHLRPLEKFIVQFYNECDNFEKLILDRKSTPKYKASFSVIKDNENGYYREVEDFIFPTSYGNYNVDATSFGFNDYTSRLVEIGDYYDSLFTDNLYRSMTHEAIKNFDWTYTREFVVGDEDEYIHGGEKMQKALRIFAREFDEILTYINNVKNLNRVTYDERSNLPDYFLIDALENSGWDVCLVYPYTLEEYVINEDGTKRYLEGEYTEQQQLDNKDGEDFIKRQFTQNTKREISPYRKELLDYPSGYFVTCDGDSPCWYNGMYGYISAEGSGSTYYDESSGKLLNRVKSFSDERKYTYVDANNEFLRRMVINSPYIWRHKGTVEGLEMILGMFGLKSKRWVERMESYRQECDKYEYDYEIVEYSSFTNRIEEKWDAVHQKYRIDWINSTKAIVYDYRNTSNYTKYGAPTDYLSYQGIPVVYRNEYILTDENDEITNEPYIKVSPLKFDVDQETTKEESEAFKRIDENNSPVIRRYLYPNFDKYEQLDGNPYFQMDGGWLSKTVQNTDDDSSRCNFQYDVDDNIAYTCYVPEGYDGEDGTGEVWDNHYLYKETVRNIRRVDTIADLISTPINELKDGAICYVSYVENDIAIIDNEVFKIKYEYNPNDETKPLRYVSLIKGDEYIKIGDSKFFNDTIIVYDKDGNESTYTLLDKQVGYEVKAYIIDVEGKKPFICKADMGSVYTIDNFMVLDDKVTPKTTNYFILDDAYYSDRLSTQFTNNGWRRLEETDSDYIKINTITNYYEGNNPHNGNMHYDSGHEYFTYFKRLFKNPIDEDLFDERCYEAFYYDLDNEIVNYGFRNLIHKNEMIKQYTPYISGLAESKIHYFGNYYKKSDEDDVTLCENVFLYGENENKRREMEKMYQSQYSKITVKKYILNDEENMVSGTPYVADNMKDINGEIIDEVTNQIMNNKRITIKFYLHEKWHKKEGQNELKYLDSIVMNYLTQMIPSTAIVDIQYIAHGESYEKKWVDGGTICIGYDLYEVKKEQVMRDGVWSDTGQQLKGELIAENSPQCGYEEPPTPPEPPTPAPRYKWVDDGTECDGVNEYYKEKEQVSEWDSENNKWGDWRDTGETRLAGLYKMNSENCGYVNPKYDWIEEGDMCEGFDRYAIEKEIVYYDDPSDFEYTGKTRKGRIIERNSKYCGYPCRFVLKTDADKVEFINPQTMAVVATKTVKNGKAELSPEENTNQLTSVIARPSKENYTYDDVTINCDGTAEAYGKVNVIDQDIIITLQAAYATSNKLYFSRVENCVISLVHKVTGQTIRLTNGDIQFVNDPCDSVTTMHKWQDNSSQMIHLEGQLADDLSNYYLNVNINTLVFMEKDNSGNCFIDPNIKPTNDKTFCNMNGKSVRGKNQSIDRFEIDMENIGIGNITILFAG